LVGKHVRHFLLNLAGKLLVQNLRNKISHISSCSFLLLVHLAYRKRTTKEYVEKRPGERNADNRIQVQLEEDDEGDERTAVYFLM